jgi:hypothetical protein
MSGAEGIEFLNKFYSKDQGNYEISLNRVIGIGARDELSLPRK